MNQIELTSSIFIAKGRDRACYHHPFQANLCVKVAVKPEKQSLREKAYLNFLTQKHTDLHAVSQYRGEVSTNLGKGYLFDLAMNYDGSLSKTLKQAIQEEAIPQQEVNKLLAQLKHYLESNLICVKDLSPNNLAYVKTNENKATLFIIDGIGLSADVDFEMVSESPLQLRDFIDELRLKFPGIIGDYVDITMFSFRKIKYSPF